MKDFDTIKKVQMFMSDANVSSAVKDFADANPELVKSKVALMNVFNGRTNGDVTITSEIVTIGNFNATVIKSSKITHWILQHTC